MKKLRVILFFLGCATFTSNVQAQDFEDLLKGSLADANYLLEGYVAPVMKSLGSGLNQG